MQSPLSFFDDAWLIHIDESGNIVKFEVSVFVAGAEAYVSVDLNSESYDRPNAILLYAQKLVDRALAGAPQGPSEDDYYNDYRETKLGGF